MNLNPKFLALMAALTVGSAAAEGTPSGTAITNTATATFTDPTTNQPVTEPVKSNTVSTTVLPKPDFDIVYRDLSDGTAATTNPLPAGYEVQTLPGGEASTAYYVQNNGNVNGYVVQLAPNTAGSPNAPVSVLYYRDTNNDGIFNALERQAGPVTSVTVPVDNLATTDRDEGVVSLIQVITVPSNAPAGARYAASPQGTADVFDGSAVVQRTEAAGDLQYSRAVVYTPVITNNPIDGDSGTAGQQPPTTTVTPPGQTTAVSGYVDPNRPGTNIVAVNGDNQSALPRADADSTPDTVTFVNSLTNGGTMPDTINLFPTNQAGAGGAPLATPNADGSFTLANGVSVRFTDTAGNPLPVGPDGYPTLTVQSGQTLNYRTMVTYPDFDSDPALDPAFFSVIVGVDSGNDAGIVADDTSTDSVYPPQLQFGDATSALGTDPAPAPVQSVLPGAASGTGTGVSTDSSAVFPMDLSNIGNYRDTYTLTGSVSVPVTNAGGTVTPQTVNVRYFTDSNADGQPDTELSFTLNGDGTRTYTAGPVLADTELKVFAVVDLPANAQATTLNGVTDLLQVSQKVSAVYSGIVREDNNDQIAVNPVGGVALTKSEPAAARPGETLSYTITAKNNFNAAIKNFHVTESNSNPSTNVFTYATFGSVTATKTFSAGTVLYRFNGAAWQASSVPTIALADVTSVDVGVDTNGNGSVDSSDLFPAQGQLDITLNVVIK